MHALRHKPLAIVIASALVLLVSVTAYAFWTSDGGGSGTAGTGTSATLVVVQTSTVEAMGPGVAAQPLSGNFNNGGDGPAYVGSVSVVVSGTSAPGCDADDYAVSGSPMTVDDQVSTGTAVGAWTGATIAFANDPLVNQDACQGATVDLTYEIVDTP
jgi:ABC-type uncharacterized transport system permease subunit